MADKTKLPKTSNKVIVPEGYDSEQEFLLEMRKVFSADIEADRENREAALEDSLFVAGEQWDPEMKAQREADNKPCLTVNRLPAFVAQVVGNRRLNETTIRVSPDVGGTKPVARIRQGIIRGAEKNSKSDRAYNNAFQNAVICGIGNFGLTLEYATDDVFDQDMRINEISNPLAVVWDRMSREPTGADAKRAFLIDSIPYDDYRTAYGDDAIPGDLGFDETLDPAVVNDGWATETDVRVVSYWRMIYEDRILGLFADGDVRDITDVPADEWMDDIVVDEGTGEPYIREKKRSFAELYVCTANKILEGPYRLPIKRIPIFRVPGWQIDTAYSRQRFGMIRFAKDPQRMHNYWRSVIVEKLMLTPKAPWVAADSAIEGRENEWRNAHLSSSTVLIYNADSGAPPKRQEPAQLEPALIQEASMAEQDIRDVTNLHEASFGQQSNEVSGRAIVARQRVGEVGTVIYNDNLELAIAECGSVMNDLIPVVYDEKRAVKVVDVSNGDEEENIVTINDVTDQNSQDITVGKYAITTHTGPSYVTRRLEAQEGMLNMTNAMPQTMALAADLIVEAQEWPGAERIAKRLKRTLPDGIEDVDPKDMTDEEKAQSAAAAEAAQEQQELERELLVLQMAEQRAKTREANAKAAKAEAEAAKMGVEIAQADEVLRLEEDKVEISAAKTAINVASMEVDNSFRILDFARDIIAPTGAPTTGESNVTGQPRQPRQ